ncbi:SigE family RNA polymerase sigma factor [Phytohabitans flavus]|uniref:RNA polymerase sigma24 factor n=1 Tax=Phytohabitans flavus TaxID=1076124 RepID=A0A6F8XW31_9ACTN|nr:SigE family RNA polymerase sigma factor [Phytohabitans flavus]BCB78009.1 RNA polymerase sigma24 factor [Phytohabitans flavus]
MDAELEDEFSAFVEASAHSLFRSALALTGHREQAEDLLQTVLARGVRHWGRIRDNNPEAYLRKALYREQASWWRSRRRGREVSVEHLPDLAVTADRTDRVDLGLVLRHALARLAPRHRAVLVLRYLEDRADAEIAEILGCTESTVRSQAARALARLRTLCPELETIDMAHTTKGVQGK